jgi:hypothetical protein
LRGTLDKASSAPGPAALEVDEDHRLVSFRLNRVACARLGDQHDNSLLILAFLERSACDYGERDTGLGT